MIDFSRNHFELFGLPARFRVDFGTLERAYRTLQSDVHPDRHAAGTDADKRLALQASARVNEAYRAWTSNPSTQLPPPCVFTALAGVTSSVTDSTNGRALALVAEVRRRSPEPRDLLAAEVLLLARGRRFAEASRAHIIRAG